MELLGQRYRRGMQEGIEVDTGALDMARRRAKLRPLRGAHVQLLLGHRVGVIVMRYVHSDKTKIRAVSDWRHYADTEAVAMGDRCAARGGGSAQRDYLQVGGFVQL